MSVIKAVQLISDGHTDSPVEEGKNHDWVMKECSVRNIPPTNAEDTKTNISCFDSATIRYAIASENPELQHALTNEHNMNMEDITIMLMSGVSSCVSSKIEEINTQKPCQNAFLINGIDFPFSSQSSLDFQRMDACRHSMGLEEEKWFFKLQQNYVHDDIFVHIYGRCGACVFSKIKNNKKIPYSVYIFSNGKNNDENIRRRTRSDQTMSSMQVMSSIKDVETFSLHRAALQLAHINAACLQNPYTQLSTAHRYLRTCWLETHLHKLATVYPMTVHDIGYCTVASKLSRMAKTPIEACNFWYLVPFCM